MEGLEIVRDSGDLLLSSDFGVLYVESKEKLQSGDNIVALNDPYIFAITYKGSQMGSMRILNTADQKKCLPGGNICIKINDATDMYLYRIGYKKKTIRQHGSGLQLFDENGSCTYDSEDRPVTFLSINNMSIDFGANDLKKAIIICTPVVKNDLDGYFVETGYQLKKGATGFQAMSIRSGVAAFCVPVDIPFHIIDVSGI